MRRPWSKRVPIRAGNVVVVVDKDTVDQWSKVEILKASPHFLLSLCDALALKAKDTEAFCILLRPAEQPWTSMAEDSGPTSKLLVDPGIVHAPSTVSTQTRPSHLQ